MPYLSVLMVMYKCEAAVDYKSGMFRQRDSTVPTSIHHLAGTAFFDPGTSAIAQIHLKITKDTSHLTL